MLLPHFMIAIYDIVNKYIVLNHQLYIISINKEKNK